jgi:hypothetical protein
MTINNSEKTIMAYQPGESGNLNGRPKGSLNRRTQLSTLLEAKAEDLINKLVELALNGDTNAMRLCIERLIPKAQTDSLKVSLPELDTTKHESSFEITTAIVNNILTGNINPDEGKKLIETVQEHQRRVEHNKFAIRF